MPVEQSAHTGQQPLRASAAGARALGWVIMMRSKFESKDRLAFLFTRFRRFSYHLLSFLGGSTLESRKKFVLVRVFYSSYCGPVPHQAIIPLCLLKLKTLHITGNQDSNQAVPETTTINSLSSYYRLPIAAQSDSV